MSPPDVRPVDAALAYAQRGWPVFPCYHFAGGRCSCGDGGCSSPGKHPHTRRGLHDATTRAEIIRRWWQRWPMANVAVRTGRIPGWTGGLVVLDIDTPHGYASLQALGDEGHALPPTRSVRTGGGGLHLYYAHPHQPVRNSAGRLGPGLDVRGEGGYVIAPPSRHASGVAYHWGPPLHLAELPAWLLPRLMRPEPSVSNIVDDVAALRHDAGVSAWAKAALDGELGRIATSTEGQRNQVLNRASFVLGQIVGGGHLDRDRVTALLEHAGQSVGLGMREARTTVDSGISAGADRPRHPPQRARSTHPRQCSVGDDGQAKHRDRGPPRIGDEPAVSSALDLRTVELVCSSGAASPTESKDLQDSVEVER